MQIQFYRCFVYPRNKKGYHRTQMIKILIILNNLVKSHFFYYPHFYHLCRINPIAIPKDVPDESLSTNEESYFLNFINPCSLTPP